MRGPACSASSTLSYALTIPMLEPTLVRDANVPGAEDSVERGLLSIRCTPSPAQPRSDLSTWRSLTSALIATLSPVGGYRGGRRVGARGVERFTVGNRVEVSGTHPSIFAAPV